MTTLDLAVRSRSPLTASKRARAWLGAALAAAMISAVGCAATPTPSLAVHAVNPARAKIVATVSPAPGHTKLDVAVTDLVDPSTFADGANYVVWYRKNQQTAWHRIGTLTYDAGRKHGEMAETIVPDTAFDLEITDERTDSPAAPSTVVVVEEHVGDTQR